ncbi:PAS domain S-box protein [Belliella marina]|uniref:histidine kinase n=1 Tax=Belliella marina TaxID=1644146 RepID=A0ABW4VIB8_9BACT
MTDNLLIKKLFDASPLPSLLILANDPIFTLLEANDAYYKIINGAPSDLIGKGLFEAFPQNPNESSEALDKILKAIKTVLETKAPYRAPIQKYDIPIRGTDQFEVRYWDPLFTPIFNEQNELTHILHTTENISMAMEAEKALFSTSKKLHDLITSIDGIFWEAEVNPLIFTYVSPQSYKLLGYHPEEWKAEGFWESRIHPYDRENTINFCSSQVQQGSNHNFEYRFIAKDGTVVWLNDVVSVILEKGKPSLLRGIMTDITHKKKEERNNSLRVAINKVFSEELNLESSIKKSLGLFLKYSGLDYAEAWLQSLDSNNIVLAAHEGPDYIQPKKEIRSNDEKVGLITELFKSNEPIFIKDLRNYQNIASSPFIHDNNIRSAMAYPITFNGKFIAGIILSSIDRNVDFQDIPVLDSDFLVQLGSMIKRKRAEYELNMFFELSPDLLCIAGFDGYFKKVNKSFYKTLGYTEEELLKKNYYEFTHPDDKVKTKNSVDTLDSGKSISYFENRYLSKSGEYVWLAWTSTPILEEKLMFGIAKDITEKKQQEEAIRISNKKVSDTLESIQDGFYAIDNEATITYWNHEAEVLLGKKREELLGKNIWEMFPEAITLKFHPYFAEAKKKNKPVRFEEFFPPLKSWYEISAFPSDEGLSVYFRDITDRKAAEEQMLELNDTLAKKAKELAESNAELEQFAFIASHDMQEPLRMVTSFLSQLERKYSNTLDTKGLQYLHYATDGAVRMRQIILDLLEFSRIGKNDNPMEKIDLNELMLEIKLINQDTLDDLGAILSWENLPKVYFEKGPLMQVLQNLITNALKYQFPGSIPKILVTGRDLEGFWEIAIEDNGIGIPKEYQTKVFEIFKRLHQKDEYSGTGIGLAICKKIIEKSGGSIHIESEEGLGSKFVFTIKK